MRARRLLLGLCLACASTSRAAPKNSELDRWLMEGIHGIYRMQFDQAEKANRRAIELDPEHPYAYLGLAGVVWTRYMYESDQSDPSLLAPIDERLSKTIEMAKRYLKKHPNDAEALMVMGGAYGLWSRLKVMNKEWIEAYFVGRKALGFMRSAIKSDPQVHDARLGLGMYDYYSDLFPRIIGPLAKLVLRGDRQRGIETLSLVAEKGHYSRNTAKILLVEIFTEDRYGARDAPKAIEIMKDLRAQYPDSAMMHSSELVAFYESERYAQVVAGAQEYLARVKAGKYKPIEAAKGNVILGCGLWAMGRKEEALAAFDAASKVLYGSRLSRWAVWAHLCAGELLDSMGRREQALARYRAAIAENDRWGVKRLAKAYLSRPYSKAGPGPITMPY